MAKNGNGKKEIDPNELTPEMLAEMEALAGRGMEDIKPDELGLPFLRMLQKGSPQCSRGDAAYIPGAIEGMWFNTFTRGMYDAVTVVPVKYVTHYVEWNPRDSGQGFVKNWGNDRTEFDANLTPGEWVAKTRRGTEIVATGTWFVIAVEGSRDKEENIPLNSRCLLNFSSTASRIGRQWVGQTTLMTLTGKDGNKFIAPLFGWAYRLSSTPTSNVRGNWMLPKVDVVMPTMKLPNGPALFKHAREYYEFATQYNNRLTYPNEMRELPPAEPRVEPQRQPGEDREESEIPF
jgi:hypothetical protein